ncbi:MAG: D-amino-acid transaminase [Alphaproteobacteria bacterium]|nr:D-amino-acid transaminase [Alphaproteobacteria bacterium]
MSRITYVNGRYLRHRQAGVHVEDRGYQFADGVYEVIAVREGRILDLEPHLDRLDRSLKSLQIAAPMARRPLEVVVREMVCRNHVKTGIVYMQVTRGVARRAHAFPKDTKPAVVVTARSLAPPSEAAVRDGVKVISVPDIRWGRCDIKSIALLPNVLARQEATAAGVYEAWLVDAAGDVTEGSSSNAWIVDQKGNLVTRNLGTALLGGVTRAALLEACRDAGVLVVEHAFSRDEALAAREAMVTSTTAFVLPVVAIDGQKVGQGKDAGRPGPVYARIRRLYEARVAAALAGTPMRPLQKPAKVA